MPPGQSYTLLAATLTLLSGLGVTQKVTVDRRIEQGIEPRTFCMLGERATY